MTGLLTIKDIVKILQISRPTAYSLISSGRLKSYRVGRLVRIKADDLRRFIEGSSPHSR